MKSVGIIGFGNFGQFMTKHLSAHVENILVYDTKDKSADAQKYNTTWTPSLEDVAQCDVVVFAVPVQRLQAVLEEIRPFAQKETLFIDVASVKIKPVEMMLENLPPEAEVLGTHPLFGPQSGKDGIKGLRIVLCPARISDETLSRVTNFLTNKLELEVLNRTPEEHDDKMAYVLGLTHFLARALDTMDIPDTDQKTTSYEYLLNMKNVLGADSYELFLTIENENPYAKKRREELIEHLSNVHKSLD